MNDLKEKASQIEDEASGHLKEQLRLQNELIQAYDSLLEVALVLEEFVFPFHPVDFLAGI